MNLLKDLPRSPNDKPRELIDNASPVSAGRHSKLPVTGISTAPRVRFCAAAMALVLTVLTVPTPVGALFDRQKGPIPREGECNLGDPQFDSVRDRLGTDQNIGPGTLKNAPIPEPTNLLEFVRDREAAIVLGKALFWDMQVGSDGIQACASCHFRAGADPRSKNQLAPGGNDDPVGAFDLLQPNAELSVDDFPLHRVADPADRSSIVLNSFDDVVSSQGVFSTEFVSVEPGASEDRVEPVSVSDFSIHGMNTRRVETRNTPTVINAVFYQRNFWDGRADTIFNGVNEFGVRDRDAEVLYAKKPSELKFREIRIDAASLASQAVGPPVSGIEMGAEGRRFRDVGKRLVSAVPLKSQTVHPEDSVLGSYVRKSGKGLKVSYAELIRRAFKPVWWQSEKIVIIETKKDGKEKVKLKKPKKEKRPQARAGSNDQLEHEYLLSASEYSMMEYNFSLFFGLAIQLYEATLVSDDAKIDQHFDSLEKGGKGRLDDTELLGMALFEQAGCADCHSGPEFSSAVARTTVTGFASPGAPDQPPEQIERMVIGTCEIAVYDQGFYNIGVRPFTEDLGIGALDPFGNPLSIALLRTIDPKQLWKKNKELLSIAYPEISHFINVPAIEIGEPSAVQGAFKIPSLRNVELTAPYFHNGSQLTLRQVVEFYNRGGDFHDHVADNGTAQAEFMDLGIGRLELTESEIDELVAFMKTLTDQRVVNQSAPFDHPELLVPDGHVEIDDGYGQAETVLTIIPAVGRNGGPLPKGFLE